MMYEDKDIENTETVESVETPSEELLEQEQPKEESKVSAPEKSFRELREKAYRLSRERDEALRYAKDIESKYAKPSEPESDDIDIGEDDIAEGKHVKAISKKLKQVSKDFDEYKRASQSMNEETRLRMEMPDLDKVISKENLETLRDEYPEFAAIIDSSKEGLYLRGKAAANIIKKLGIYKEDTFTEEKALVRENSLKPKPAATISSSGGALSQANAFARTLTPEMKKKLQEEVRECKKRGNF